MKRLQPLLLALMWLGSSCQTQSQDETPAVSASHPQTNQAAESYQPTLGSPPTDLIGDWVSAAYWDSVRLYRSPFRARRAAEGFSALSIRSNSGTLAFWPGYSNHEGGVLSQWVASSSPQPVRVQPALTGSDNQSSYSLLSWQIRGADSLLQVRSFEASDKLTGTHLFRRALRNPNSNDDLGVGMQYMLRSTLFAGVFTGVDSADRPASVRFAPTGRFLGIPPFQTFDVQADFVVPLDNNLDQLFLANRPVSKRPSKTRRLTYIFRGDSLYLFSPKTVLGSDNAEVLRHGRRLYALIRRI